MFQTCPGRLEAGPIFHVQASQQTSVTIPNEAVRSCKLESPAAIKPNADHLPLLDPPITRPLPHPSHSQHPGYPPFAAAFPTDSYLSLHSSVAAACPRWARFVRAHHFDLLISPRTQPEGVLLSWLRKTCCTSFCEWFHCSFPASWAETFRLVFASTAQKTPHRQPTFLLSIYGHFLTSWNTTSIALRLVGIKHKINEPRIPSLGCV
ncbi:hypothetical protein VTI74DRAFT_7325 [Chaetomium olivicolor]